MFSSILHEFIHVYHLVMNLEMDARSLVMGCSGCPTCRATGSSKVGYRALPVADGRATCVHY